MIAQLDDAVSREGALVTLSQYGGGPDESQIIANERGYLRLGIELMKAAFAPAAAVDSNVPHSVALDLDYLLTNDSTISFDWCERREPESDVDRVRTGGDSVLIAFMITFLIGFLGLTLIGLVTVLRWVGGWLIA